MHIVLFSGLSGAGKSTALRAAEDFGYFCVDNLPSALIKKFAQMCQSSSPGTDRAALVVDCRDVQFEKGALDGVNSLKKLKINHAVIFLDCRDDVLVKRFKETRREHPLAREEKQLLEAINLERSLLQPMKERADFVIDTSDLSAKQLRAVLGETLEAPASSTLRLVITSFGYKRGLPLAADMVLDMRFLPNPFYVEALRPLSGNDAAVAEYVFSFPEAVAFMDQVEQLIRTVGPGFIAQDKPTLSVAFGCTGGRHRSVAMANELASRLKDVVSVSVYHRDLDTEARDIHERFEP